MTEAQIDALTALSRAAAVDQSVIVELLHAPLMPPCEAHSLSVWPSLQEACTRAVVCVCAYDPCGRLVDYAGVIYIQHDGGVTTT